MIIFKCASMAVQIHKKGGKMNRKLKCGTLAAALICLFMTGASAMHIAEGFLPARWCLLWYALCVPFIVAGFFAIRKAVQQSAKSLSLLAMCGAFAFVLSALKIPSVNGSCSHMTGVGLGAILFGPAAAAVLGLIVLLFQALLLAHGGISTLGANVFAMAIVGPLAAYGIYRLLKAVRAPRSVSVFAAAFAGDIVTYIVTSFQLAGAFGGADFGGALAKFLSIFAVTQLPLAVAEGLLTVVVFGVLEKYSASALRDLRVLDAGGERA